MDVNTTLQSPTEQLPNLHIGKTIINDLREEGRTVVWLAKKVGMGRTSIYQPDNTKS